MSQKTLEAGQKGRTDANHFAFTGYTGKPASLRTTPSGAHVAEVSVACDRTYTANGKTVTVTSWFNVAGWGALADVMAKYLNTKGRKVLVMGRLEIQEWEADGQKHSKVVVTASTLQFLDAPKQADGAPAAEPALPEPELDGAGENDPF